MPRFQTEPFYTLTSVQGRRDIYNERRARGVSLWLVREVISDTWFSLMLKLGRRK